jgi:polysaccharide deacetylase 2 family uncharacterized protein YibQ
MAANSNHSFMYYIVFILGLSTLLAVTGLLAVSFWISRPINLKGETDRLADSLETALTDNFVPGQAIARDAALPEFLDHEGVEKRWNFHSFSVTLPPHVKSETLKNELRKAMAAHSVKLVDEEKQEVTGHERFSLYYDNLAFATVTLIPGEAEDSPGYRSDLRNVSAQVADLVANELASIGLDPPHTRADAIDREDLNARWNYTYFTAQLPPGMTLGSLKERLESRNVLPDVVFSSEVSLAPPVSLAALVAGKPCVGIACTLTPPDATHQPEVPATLEDVLNDGILGSEPDESLEVPMDDSGMVVTPVVVAPDAPPEPSGSTEAPAPVEMPAETALPLPERSPAEAPLPETETSTEPEKAPAAETPAPQAMALPPGGKIRLAVLIDDGGNNSSHGDRILALDSRLTLAILPNTPFAAEIAEEGAEKGFEIMLHMPMETDSETVQSVPGTVFTKMGKEEIQKLTNAAIDQIPHVVGINNHTGSKFTSNREKMDFVLEVLKDRGLYFIDSVTIHTSVAFDAAREMGVPTARRDVFLDDATDIGSVRRQWAILLETAQKHGQAIGIGHFQCPATAKVLAEEIPKLAEAGIELVHASELLQ